MRSNDGATDNSIPAATATAIIATNKPIKAEAVDSNPFQEGEKVLGFHGSCLYDAKVQKVENRMDGWRYFVHYRGWNNKWDEWLGVDRLLKRTAENVQRQKELKEKLAMEKNAKLEILSRDKPKRSIGVRGKKRKHEAIDKDDGVVPLEKVVNIQIPFTLKKQLVDDYECIAQLGQLVKLPRSPSVYEILNKYFDYRVKKDGKIVDSVAEIVMGLRCYFDKALPTVLLYKNERQQYKEVVVDNISPSSVYGAEHLLRLFVKFPEMLSRIHIEMETLTELQQKLVDFLRFLQANQSVFFLSNYQTLEGFATTVKEEDN